MTDWKKHWESFPVDAEDKCFFQQVGKTVNKVPISDEQFGEIIRSVIDALALGPDDSVLDLCCGNGIITSRVSRLCGSVTGVDFSAKLIEVARNHHAKDNIEYIQGDVKDIGKLLAGKQYSKAYMYEALQHFAPKDLALILDSLKVILKPGAAFFAGSVPDNELKWEFYNTPERRAEYHQKVSEGTEAIGTWWDKQAIELECLERGFKVTFIDQPRVLHTAHYRFDMLIEGF